MEAWPGGVAGRADGYNTAMLRVKPAVLVDPGKPGRRIEFVDFSKIEKAMGGKVRHVYHNTIKPGAVAGDHWHKHHAVAVDVRAGRLEIVLEDIKSGRQWRGIVKAGDPLLVIPGHEYHAARNPGPGIAQATMYATTPPRNEGDSYEYEPKRRLFPKRAFAVAHKHAS